jgi:hypothetical protein
MHRSICIFLISVLSVGSVKAQEGNIVFHRHTVETKIRHSNGSHSSTYNVHVTFQVDEGKPMSLGFAGGNIKPYLKGEEAMKEFQLYKKRVVVSRVFAIITGASVLGIAALTFRNGFGVGSIVGAGIMIPSYFISDAYAHRALDHMELAIEHHNRFISASGSRRFMPVYIGLGAIQKHPTLNMCWSF